MMMIPNPVPAVPRPVPMPPPVPIPPVPIPPIPPVTPVPVDPPPMTVAPACSSEENSGGRKGEQRPGARSDKQRRIMGELCIKKK